MGRTYRGEQRDQFKGRINNNKSKKKGHQKKSWQEPSEDDKVGREALNSNENWDR